MGKFLSELHDELRYRRTTKVFDDFLYYVSTDLWTTTADGSATATVGANQDGLLVLSAVDSTLNRQVYLATTNAIYLIANNKPIIAEVLLQFTEANTNKANVGFGLCSTGGALGTLADNTGEPVSTYSGATIYKVPGGTNWKTNSSLGTTQTTTTSNQIAGDGGTGYAASSTYQRLRIQIEPVSSTIAEVTYWLNDSQLQDNTTGRPGQHYIKDQLTYTGALKMKLWVGLKNGSTSPETLSVDYLACDALRQR